MDSIIIYAHVDKHLVSSEFRLGNHSPLEGILQMLKSMHNKFQDKRLKRRSDSADYQSELFNYCEQSNITYFISVPQSKSVVNNIKTIPEDAWSTYNSDLERAECTHCMENTEKLFRIIVLREKDDIQK